MSEQKFPDEGIRPEDMSLDELIQSTKEDISQGAPTTFEPTLPTEYAELVSEEEEQGDLAEEEYDDRYRMPGIIKALLYTCCVLAAAIVLAVFAWKCADEVCALTAEDHVVTVTVPENASMNQVIDLLHEKGLISYKWLFRLYCMVSGAEEKIDPGTYQLNAVFDYHALIYGMIETSENRAVASVTIPEGYEAEDIFRLLEENGVCDAASLEQAAAEYEFDFWFLEDIEYGDYRRLEGYLFPDTYQFYLDDDPENVLAKFLRNFDNKLTEELKADLTKLNEKLRQQKLDAGFTESEIEDLTIHDVITVASLVEKESTSSAESGEIASVIYNRLCSKIYPCLNIDATIQYVLPERKEILTNADKAVISPYNTYTNAGLPVGPISSPGMSSIRAALYPEDTDYCFYAIDPAGGHHFSETVYEHQAFLDSLLGEEVTEETVTVSKQTAIETALEEARQEQYQFQPEESDLSENAPTAELVTGGELTDWQEEWAVTDDSGAKLFGGQPVWAVRLLDQNDPPSSLIIYVDAETGAVVGAGQPSE